MSAHLGDDVAGTLGLAACGLVLMYVSREAARHHLRLWMSQLPALVLFGVLVSLFGGVGAAVGGGPVVISVFSNAWIGISQAIDDRGDGNRRTR